ncbi:DNA polymerase I [Acetivibrio mesophilus]|uniref:DNA polymerase I n=1 Tax=Acetivibrio mesophilus TaxID=2487273 RepID=A0A4Q0I5S8_9FIRM|nr:DNA polymerase I [Acetivibrio mesophilus]ODM25256.1 DNA polymerase I [Clostridium sp. Bc-iso-3]RXE59724.1 DNA polymerase I [Acetivibrio mesophilus]
MSKQKLMAIDGNSIINRAFYGLRELLVTSDGTYTNGIYGFINMMQKFIEEEKPQYICVAFDLKAPTFRHSRYEGYKANRKGMPEELRVQVPLLKEVLDAMNIRRLEMEGFEADDILGSISLCAEKKGLEVILVTGDRDAYQLVGPSTKLKLPRTKGGKTDVEEYDYNRIVEVYGIKPEQFVDVKALMGDASDNIPGVPGIGEKTALDLIREYNNLENLYSSLDSVKKKGLKEKLETFKEQAFMSRELALIERNMPSLCDIEDLKVVEIDRNKTYEIFKRLEFKSFIDKFGLNDAQSEDSLELDIKIAKNSDELKELKNNILRNRKVYIYYLIDKTGSFSQKLAACAISSQEDEAWYVDFENNINEDEFFRQFKDILEDESIKKYGHDFKNFIVYLNNRGIDFNGLAFDTMIGAYIINSSKDTYAISELAMEYLNLNIKAVEELSGKGKNFTLYRDMQQDDLSKTVGIYPYVINKVNQKMDNILKENDQEQLYYSIELPLVRTLADMEYHGFKVNVNALVEFSKEMQEKIDVITKEIYSLAGEEFNINSPKQLGVILFEKLGLPIIKKTKTGYSTDAEVLEELSDRHEIVEKILEYRQLMKLKSTYVEGLLAVINPHTGKIHSSFNQTVTVTGRISSTEPNLQNIPIKLEMGRKIRKVFIPSDENYQLLDADYSQIELRVLAHITDDENMINSFLNNEDIHTSTASKVFGIPKEEVTSIMRSRAKAVNFGIVYGIGDFSLAKDLKISRKEARMYIDGYLDRYPNVKKYMHDIVEEGKEKGFVTTMFMRRRYLPELKSRNFNIRSFGERIAMNTPIQGSAADIIKIAMVKVHGELKKRKLRSRLILQVHDELIIEVFKEEKEEVEKILSEGMQNAVSLKVPLIVEVKSGNNWYETK